MQLVAVKIGWSGAKHTKIRVSSSLQVVPTAPTKQKLLRQQSLQTKLQSTLLYAQ
jgi:hypothetical protein